MRKIKIIHIHKNYCSYRINFSTDINVRVIELYKITVMQINIARRLCKSFLNSCAIIAEISEANVSTRIIRRRFAEASLPIGKHFSFPVKMY